MNLQQHNEDNLRSLVKVNFAEIGILAIVEGGGTVSGLRQMIPCERP
jgi:hypothetical protein